MHTHIFLKWMTIKNYILWCCFFLLSNIAFTQVDVFDHITTKDGLPSNYVFGVIQDKKGFLWAGTDKGLCRFDGMHWKTWDIEDGLPGNYVSKLILCKDGTLEIEISEKGVYKFNTDNIDKPIFLKTNKVYLHYSDSLQVANTNIKHTIDSILKLNYRYYRTAWHGKTLYIGQFGNGVFQIDSNNTITHYNQKWGLSTNDVNTVFVTKNGQLLVCTLGEGIQVLVKKQRHTFVHVPDRVLQVASNGQQAFALAKGKLHAINGYQLKTTSIASNINKMGWFGNTLVASTFQEIIFANVSGTNVSIKKSIPFTAGVSSIIDFENFAILSSYGAGVLKIEKKQLVATKCTTSINNNIEHLVKLSQHQFAALTTDDGCFIADTTFKHITHLTTQNGLLSNNVNNVLATNDTLFIATKKGISVFKQLKWQYNITSSEGFVGNTVFAMFKDDAKTIWMLTNLQLLYLQTPYKLNFFQQANTFTNNSQAILCANYNYSTKQLYVGKADGLTVLNINAYNTHQNEAIPITTNLYLQQQQIIGNVAYFPYNYKDAVIKCSVGFSFFNHQKSLQYSINGQPWQWVDDSLHIGLNNLLPGNYNVSIRCVQSNGLELPTSINYTIIIKNPWWMQWWFVLGCLLLATILIVYFTNQYNKRKFMQHLQIQHQVEEERKRISRDLHDNMGAYTTALLSNVESVKQRGATSELMQKMQANAQEILTSLKDTIWLLNNKTSTLQELIDNYKTYSKRLIQNFLNIELNVVEDIQNNVQLTSTKALHVKKVLHEALQNSIKHSQATAINVVITSNKTSTTILIKDNGVGFNMEQINFGDGLLNMQWRAKEAGFQVFINSQINKGTIITLVL